MKFFTKLFGKKEKQNHENLLEQIELFPSLMLPRALEPFKEEILKNKRTSIKINATVNKEIKIKESHFGYYPCLPLLFEYPKDSRGNFMFPLAQINCNELPNVSPFPNCGYLQFYISNDEDFLYGLDVDNPTNQTDFRILYFRNDQVEEYQTDFEFLKEILSINSYSPISKSLKLSFELIDDYYGLNDAQYLNKENNIENIIKNNYKDIEDEISDIVYDSETSNGHKIGGYAYFTQWDPRDGNEEFKNSLLLLQIDSDNDIMWGDVGVGNFFIKEEDLKNLNFSNVLYNWDCC